MGLFTVAAGRQPFRMAWRGARLADLIQVRQERKDSLAFAAQVHQRLAAAQGSPRELEAIVDQLFRILHVRLAVGLFLGPTGPGDQQEVGLGADGLRVGRGFAHAHHRGALAGLRHRHGEGLDAGGPAFALPDGLGAGINQDDPGPLGALQDGFHALAVIPAVNGELPVAGG